MCLPIYYIFSMNGIIIMIIIIIVKWPKEFQKHVLPLL